MYSDVSKPLAIPNVQDQGLVLGSISVLLALCQIYLGLLMAGNGRLQDLVAGCSQLSSDACAISVVWLAALLEAWVTRIPSHAHVLGMGKKLLIVGSAVSLFAAWPLDAAFSCTFERRYFLLFI